MSRGREVSICFVFNRTKPFAGTRESTGKEGNAKKMEDKRLYISIFLQLDRSLIQEKFPHVHDIFLIKVFPYVENKTSIFINGKSDTDTLAMSTFA